LPTTAASAPECCGRGAARERRERRAFAATVPPVLGFRANGRATRACGGSAVDVGARSGVSACDASCASSAKPRHRAFVASVWL
jgi:hypothetical protein